MLRANRAINAIKGMNARYDGFVDNVAGRMRNVNDANFSNQVSRHMQKSDRRLNYLKNRNLSERNYGVGVRNNDRMTDQAINVDRGTRNARDSRIGVGQSMMKNRNMKMGVAGVGAAGVAGAAVMD